MRKELSDFVKIKVLKKANTVAPELPEFSVSAYSKVNFEESAKKSTAGILYQQSLRLIITKEEAKRMPLLPVLFKGIVELSDCDARYIWGTSEIPVEITITPYLETVQLSMSCNSLIPLLRG